MFPAPIPRLGRGVCLCPCLSVSRACSIPGSGCPCRPGAGELPEGRLRALQAQTLGTADPFGVSSGCLSWDLTEVHCRECDQPALVVVARWSHSRWGKQPPEQPTDRACRPQSSDMPLDELLALYGYEASDPISERDSEGSDTAAHLPDMTLDKVMASLGPAGGFGEAAVLRAV